MEEENVIRPHQEIQALTIEEKKFLLAVERGDVAGTRRYVKFVNNFFLDNFMAKATQKCLITQYI